MTQQSEKRINNIPTPVKKVRADSTFGPLLFVMLLAVFIWQGPAGAQEAMEPSGRDFSAAGPDLAISPTFIYFDGRERTKDIYLLNRSDKTLTYRAQWRHNKMTEAGGLELQDGPLYENFNFDEHFRFSPRQVTLPPRSRQVVRLSLRRPEALPDGDYHSHFMLSRMPGEGAAPTAVDSQQDGVGIRVDIGFAVAVPVFVNQGERAVDVAIGMPRFQEAGPDDSGPSLIVPVERRGPYSALGQLEVIHIDSAGAESVIGRIGNANIYSEVDRREFQVALRVAQVTEGTVLIRYRDSFQAGQPVLAEREVSIRP